MRIIPLESFVEVSPSTYKIEYTVPQTPELGAVSTIIGTSGSEALIALTCARRRIVSSGRRMKRSVSEVVNAAKDHREGVISGVIRSCLRRKRGEAAEKVAGMAWEKVVGSQRLEGATMDGRARILASKPRGGCHVGVRISRVRMRSMGARRRAVIQLDNPTMTSEPKGLGEELRSRPEKPAALLTLKPGPRPLGSGPRMSGRPTMARSRLRMKLSVVRSRMV
jgi:hypothetical protein